MNFQKCLPVLESIKKRKHFLLASKKGRFSVRGGLILQGIEDISYPGSIGYGLTVTKRLDKRAVYRNRMRRRLREVCRLILSKNGKTGWNYVLIARQSCLTRPFALLQEDLQKALAEIHADTYDAEKAAAMLHFKKPLKMKAHEKKEIVK